MSTSRCSARSVLADPRTRRSAAQVGVPVGKRLAECQAEQGAEHHERSERVASAVDDDWAALGRAGLGWALGGGTFFLMWFIYPKGLGYGDVRLAGLLAMALAWVGWAEFAVGIYAGFLLGGVVGGALVLARVVDRRRFPFGPFMVLGALVGLTFGHALVEWYSHLGS